MLWIFENITLKDILDILILSFLISRAIQLIQGTRAMQSLLGIGILVLIYLLALEFELQGVVWLLQTFSVYLGLILIIIFQEDIRIGLARAGNFFPTIYKGKETLVLEELIKVSQFLSSRRIGALIALERSASLQEYIEPAVSLDALVNSDLLISLFLPTSPLHDGAVIIKENRLSCAKAHFPLTQNNISKLYGTRHCAAIGLTELTDALVVVISEERGTISVAQQGKIRVMVDGNDMRRHLQKILSNPSEEPK
ncbi:MAG: TIGR00159 family protein [Proteobacteria bacterium]|nr:TIGR00159 family protein [Pseudomonadota bacterium]